MSLIENPFLETIRLLREQEEILLHTKTLDITKEQEIEVSNYLHKQYEIECRNYPIGYPVFNPEAALWAAKTVYRSAQLFLYREHKETELELLFEPYKDAINATSIISVDLCLRFLPFIASELKLIDPADKLIPLLDQLLLEWHYSCIGYEIPLTQLVFEPILTNTCLLQLYTDRVIERKDKKRAHIPIVYTHVKGCLADHHQLFWNNLD